MTNKTLLKILIISLAPLLSINAAMAHWSLDNETSQLSFVSVKADNVAEVHTFDVLSGTIDDEGSVAITIELASVNTLIPIRNERMQAMLFETNLFPQATITATVDLAALTGMEPGTTVVRQLPFQLVLHGVTQALTADVLITRLASGAVVSTMKPLIVTADSFGLVAGVEKLREVAGLTRISNAVPVSFTVVFEQGD